MEIIEAHAMPDRIHLLVRKCANEKVSSFILRYRYVAFASLGRGYLKGKSTMIIFERYAHLKYKLRKRHFWSRGYYVITVGNNKQAVQKYIQNQAKKDLISAQMSMVEYYDPFEKWLKSNQDKKDRYPEKEITGLPQCGGLSYLVLKHRAGIHAL